MEHSIHDPSHHATPNLQSRVRVAAAVVWREGRLLLTQRPPGGALGLHWEFPGGKIEPGESPEHALVREIREELNVGAKTHEVVGVDTHDYPHGLEVEITFIRCTLDSDHLHRGPGVHDFRWWKLDEIDLAEVLAGDRDFLTQLKRAPREPGA
jgi:8-oxo-dGTP diphosphatase